MFGGRWEASRLGTRPGGQTSDRRISLERNAREKTVDVLQARLGVEPDANVGAAQGILADIEGRPHAARPAPKLGEHTDEVLGRPAK